MVWGPCRSESDGSTLWNPFAHLLPLLLPGSLPELRGKKQMARGKGQNGISVAAGGETRKGRRSRSAEMKHKFSPDDGMKRDTSIIQITSDDVKRKKKWKNTKKIAFIGPDRGRFC
jgi:hypothetical protein